MGTRMLTVTLAAVTPDVSETFTAQTKSVAVAGTPLGAKSTPVTVLKVSQEGRAVHPVPLASLTGGKETNCKGIEPDETLPGAANCKL